MNQSEDLQLGARGKRYSVRKAKVIFISLFYGLIAITMSAICVFFSWKVNQGHANPLYMYITIIIISGMFGLLGFVMMPWRLKDIRKKVQLYTSGIVIFGNKEPLILPYSQIERIYWEITGSRKWFRKNQTIHILKIDTKDCEQIQLSSKLYAKSQELMETIEKEVSSRLLETGSTKLNQGEETHFDQVAVHLEYLRIPEGYISWEDFGGITLQNGMVYLINKLDEPFYGIKLSKFPNFALFTNLTQHICELYESKRSGLVV